MDNEKSMLRQIRKAMAEHIKSGRLTVVDMDVTKSLPDGPFNVVTTGFCLHNLEKKERDEALRKVYEILPKGGLFVIGDKIAYENKRRHYQSLLWQIYKFITVYGKMRRFDLIKEWVSHYLYDNRPKICWREHEAVEQLKELGFDVEPMLRRKMDMIMVAIKK